MKKNTKPLQRWEDAAQLITEWSGRPWAFGVALLLIVLWAGFARNHRRLESRIHHRLVAFRSQLPPTGPSQRRPLGRR